VNRALLVLTGVAFCSAALAQPAIRDVVNAASYDRAVPRGCLASIFGTGMARSTTNATSLPLPTRLDGTAVLVGDLELEAPLYFVSPTQISFQVPFEALGDRLRIVVATAQGRSAPFTLVPTAGGPGVFTRSGDGKGAALVFDAAFQPLDAVVPGNPMIVYATGLGATDPPVLSGRGGATAEPFNRVTTVPEAFVGDAPAQVIFAGLAPDSPGVYQLNIVPQSTATDRFWILSRGQTSNMAEVGIRPGQNVTNATGTIALLFPVPQGRTEPIGQSPHAIVARFTARFDIAPNAGPFSVTAVADGDARSVVNFDPANGTYEGVVTVPTIPARFGDFSGSGFSVIDLFTCHNAPDGTGICHPFPGSIVPANRIPTHEREALEQLPLPDGPVNNGATGLIRVRGEARRGSTFTISGDSNSRLSTFAGYVSIPLPPEPRRTTTLKLYIDGRRVASTEVSYLIGPFGISGDAP
jgi:uncharacterized protein (TIGR03437 family)